MCRVIRRINFNEKGKFKYGAAYGILHECPSILRRRVALRYRILSYLIVLKDASKKGPTIDRDEAEREKSRKRHGSCRTISERA